MDADGGMSKYPGNKAGAKYDTGYCDAQCPCDIKFINGEANCEGWGPSPSDKNSGAGKYGTCCNEMNIWEANRISTVYTPHVCTVERQTRCEGSDCGLHTGFCDKAGCDFNPYRLGDKTFFGPSNNFTVDSTKPFTVVTKFITADGTDNGDRFESTLLELLNDAKFVEILVKTTENTVGYSKPPYKFVGHMTVLNLLWYGVLLLSGLSCVIMQCYQVVSSVIIHLRFNNVQLSMGKLAA